MRELVEKIDSRSLLLIISGTILLLVVLMVSTFIVPLYKEYRAVVKTEALLESAAGSGNQLLTMVNQTELDIGVLQRQLHGEMADLPIRQLESFIIGKLQRLSWENRIELVSVRPGKGETVKNFREITFDVALYGKYMDFFNWLNALGDELGFVVIKSFDMAPTQNNELDPELSIRLMMVSYRAAES